MTQADKTSCTNTILKTPGALAHVDYSITNGVAEMILNRPEVHNAFDGIMISNILIVLNYFSTLPDCQVLILKACGKHFSAGADLQWMRQQAKMSVEQNKADAGQLAQLMQQLDTFPKPTVALIQGAAFGGALGLICCCDIAIASPNASFCLSEVKLGLIPAVISPYVMRAMGRRAARRYMISAEQFDTSTALKFNIIHEVSEDLALACQHMLQKLLANSPQAMAWIKHLLADLPDGEINHETLEHTSESIARIRVSPEGQEGLNAFFEKRAPNWQANRPPPATTME